MILGQGLLALAFFQASAATILLVLYLLLFRGYPHRFFRIWLAGWTAFTGFSYAQVYYVLHPGIWERFLALQFCVISIVLLGASVFCFLKRDRWIGWLIPVAVAGSVGITVRQFWFPQSVAAQWVTNFVLAAMFLTVGWALWRRTTLHRGYGPMLLSGALLMHGLHMLDQADWAGQPWFVLRLSFDGLLDVAIGVAMAVLVLEAGRGRIEDLNEKLRRLTLITAAATQSFRVDDVLQKVLEQLVESLSASHGLVRVVQGEGSSATLVLRASVGVSERYLQAAGVVSVREPWARRLLEQGPAYLSWSDVAEGDPEIRRLMEEEKLSALIMVRLPGKEQPLGVLGIGSNRPRLFQDDEVTFLVNVANLLGLTIQNLYLFEQIAEAQRQWMYTFDSISDPILVHDRDFRLVRSNRTVSERTGRDPSGLVGLSMHEVLEHGGQGWANCPYCEGIEGRGEGVDPTFGGYLLATNSSFHDPRSHQGGTIHVLKNITEHKMAEQKYHSLFGNMQEGVFISTPDGHFVDFNDAFMKMMGFQRREDLLKADIASTFYVNPSDRDRLKRLLREQGGVTDFEFQMRRPDGEILTVCESSIAARDEFGNVTSYQGFVLDVTERKRAEQEIRRRNQELTVLNSIANTLGQPLELDEMLARALRQIVELFKVDLGGIYLLDEGNSLLRRHAAVGFRSEYARYFPPTAIPRELIDQLRSARATVVAAQSLPLPPIFRDVQQKEELQVSHVVMLWSKDHIMGGLVVACRSVRDFSGAELNLLTAVGNQLATAIEKDLLYQETRQAYDNLRRTQEQLLQSEKMVAVGQLISGVAHELNNPLTAILGYSQLLAGSEHVTPRGSEYVQKLYKQAQRTHRIVQNLLSFARQHKPERAPVQIAGVLDDTIALREYDLKVNNIIVHRHIQQDMPLATGDAHQLQQVFLNVLNNAVDAVLEHAASGEIWVVAGSENGSLFVEFTDSGPGVTDPKRVFDPFYTTKPVGKGTGLGLSICYGIIKEHGGEIEVRNSAPRGATFRVTLPMQRVSAAGGDDAESPRELAPQGVVLVVDDEESLLELEQEILRAHDLTVLTARNGREALDVLSRDTVDVVVTDLKMPGDVSGRNVFEWVEARRPRLHTRVVFTMSDARREGVSELIESSGCSYLQKPFNVEDFLRVVRQALHQAQASQAAALP